jgi:phosphotransferase system  glucose/maltose/N-acetylglucosamine-specific IIC component
MDGLVLFIGGALIVASGITTGQLKDLYNIIGDNSKQSQPIDHTHAVMFLGEFVFLAILAMIAGASEEGGKAIIALLLALWLVFITQNNVRVAGWLSAFTPKKV